MKKLWSAEFFVFLPKFGFLHLDIWAQKKNLYQTQMNTAIKKVIKIKFVHNSMGY